MEAKALAVLAIFHSLLSIFFGCGVSRARYFVVSSE